MYLLQNRDDSSSSYIGALQGDDVYALDAPVQASAKVCFLWRATIKSVTREHCGVELNSPVQQRRNHACGRRSVKHPDEFPEQVRRAKGRVIREDA